MDSGSGTAGRIALRARALAPALGERRERGRRVGAVEELDAGALLAVHGGPEQVAEAVVEHRLGPGDGGARDVVEARGPRREALVEVAGPDDLVDEAVALGPCDVAQGAREQQLARGGLAHGRGQEMRAGV